MVNHNHTGAPNSLHAAHTSRNTYDSVVKNGFCEFPAPVLRLLLLAESGYGLARNNSSCGCRQMNARPLADFTYERRSNSTQSKLVPSPPLAEVCDSVRPTCLHFPAQSPEQELYRQLLRANIGSTTPVSMRLVLLLCPQPALVTGNTTTSCGY